MKKFQFSFNNPIKKDFPSEDNIAGTTVSCFMTDSKYIICFYVLKIDTLNFRIIALNENLDPQVTIPLEYKMDSNYDYFFKCIHLKGDIGVFIFYGYIPIVESKNKNPIILIKTYNSNLKIFKDHLSFRKIKLEKMEFNDDDLLNDLIKISDEKICFTSTSDDKQKLYIAIIKILDTSKVVIRYYSIEIYHLNNFKFLSEMRQHLFNNYISFAFSFCTQYSCSTDSDTHYSGFMIFSYANGTDYNLNLNYYLFLNNDIKIDNFVINLKKHVKIDNNVFGLVYKGIKINDIINCNNIEFVSTINENYKSHYKLYLR